MLSLILKGDSEEITAVINKLKVPVTIIKRNYHNASTENRNARQQSILQNLNYLQQENGKVRQFRLYKYCRRHGYHHKYKTFQRDITTLKNNNQLKTKIIGGKDKLGRTTTLTPITETPIMEIQKKQRKLMCDETKTLNFKPFSIETCEPTSFIKALNKLLKKYEHSETLLRWNEE